MRETVGGFQPIYLDTEYHGIMIEVGRELGVAVVDARPILNGNNGVFIDMSHPDERGHARIAELLVDAIKVVAPSLAKGAVGVSNSKGHRDADHEVIGSLEVQSATQ